jgi:hypothetical protein
MFAQGFFVGFFRIAPAVTAGQRRGVPVRALIVHIGRIWAPRTGRLLECAEPDGRMWERLACAAMLCVGLGACQETKLNDPTLIAGGGPVTVVQSRYVSSGDSTAMLGAGAVTYVVSTVELTNEQSLPIYPIISHFTFFDRSGNRYFGIDTGSSVLAGTSNDLSPLKPGAKRKFIVAFRADATAQGTISYDY